ncbi:MAG: DNA phosphorothioation-associated putative methyltransferase [Cellvibrionaceae bacterium]|nr:DNA phosphorothioation-associated putative methyltransferase [Cellvibrionaceae bacterium]
MNPNEFQALVKSLPTGKSTPKAIYVHESAIHENKLLVFLETILSALKQNDLKWNVAKFAKGSFQLSYLFYPEFETTAYPSLEHSLYVDLDKNSFKLNDYSKATNPPILHRKEQMVLPEHPNFEDFKLTTEEGVSAGLYENGAAIGFKLGWLSIIEAAGYELVDGRLFRSSMVTPAKGSIDRHKTAISRQSLSSPMKLLQRYGYLEGQFSIFDYGCGLGDDLAELQANGINANGWDPNFLPNEDLVSADIVNLGFVLNVIEDVAERVNALQRAFDLAEKLIVISCMLASESFIAGFKPFKDGVITSNNTFQKYFTQTELKTFVQDVLEDEPITLGSGIVVVFKCKEEQQQFLLGKHRRIRSWSSSTMRTPRKSKLDRLLEDNDLLVQEFTKAAIELGRCPADDEFSDSALVKEVFGSFKKLFNLICKGEGGDRIEDSAKAKREDYLVYLALEKFSQRKKYKSLPEEHKRDIKVFFQTYTNACLQAESLLFDIANPELIRRAAEEAYAALPASMFDGDCLIMMSCYVSLLPSLLRVYVGAASHMFGDWEEADLVKVHLDSGKVSFLVYDDFSAPVPHLKERIKVRLAEQEIDYFDYVNTRRRPPLLGRSQYLESNFDNYDKQLGLDRRLAALGMLKFQTENLTSRGEWESFLDRNNITIRGFRIFRV